MRVAERALGDAAHDELPGLAVIAGPVDPGVPVVDLVAVHGEVGRPGVVARGLDVADGAPLRHPPEVGGDVGPALPAVLGELHQPVIGPRPDEPGLEPRLGDGEHDARVLDADVVGGPAARDLLRALVVPGQIGADHLPAVAAVGGLVDVLASGVDALGVVGADGERRGPDEPVLEVGGGPPAGALRPDLHVPRGAGAEVVAEHEAAPAAGARRGGPDDVGVGRVRRGPAALAAGHRVPHAARNRSGAPEAAQLAVAGAAGGGAVLPVANHVVGDRVVHGGGVHLAARQADPEPGLSAVLADRDAGIVADHEAVAVGGVDPHVVVVPARGRGERHVQGGAAPVQRLAEGGRGEVSLVLVVGGGGNVVVVRGSAAQLAVVAHQGPVLAGVVGAPELAAVGLLAVDHRTVSGLDERVDPVGIHLRNGQAHLAHGLLGEPVAADPLPGGAAVLGDEEPASRAAALPAPGVELELPHSGPEDARVSGVHDQVGRAGRIVDEEHPLPGLPAVHGAVDAALGLRPVAVALGGGEDDVRVGGVDHDPRDAAGVLEAHEGPVLPGVGGLVDPPAHRDVAPDPRLAGAGPDDVGVGRGRRERADRGDRLVVEDRLPVDAAVAALPDPARCGAGVVGERIADDAGHGGDPG